MPRETQIHQIPEIFMMFPPHDPICMISLGFHPLPYRTQGKLSIEHIATENKVATQFDPLHLDSHLLFQILEEQSQADFS